jgi:regulatory protein
VEEHKRSGALNDAAFAETKLHSLRRAGRSARRITQHLAHKGVKGEVIEAALAEDEEGAERKAALALARRRGLGPYRKGGASEDRAVRAKEMASMARAGFSFDIIKKVLGAGPDDLDEF